MRLYNTKTENWELWKEKPNENYLTESEYNEKYAILEDISSLSQEELLAVKKTEFLSVIDGKLNETAQAAGYENILSAVSYQNSERFGEESRAFTQWRDDVYTWGYKLLDEVQSGIKAIPSKEEVLAGMPQFNYTKA